MDPSGEQRTLSPFDSLHRSPHGNNFPPMDNRTATDFDDHFAYAGCHMNAESSAICAIHPDCTLCLTEPDVTGYCRYPANAEEPYHLPGCTAPGCDEAICNECAEEYCEDCNVDCESDCGSSFGCEDIDNKADTTYCFEESPPELFGDQTAQTFGFGRRLPQLTMDNTTAETTKSDKSPHNAASSTLPEYGMEKSHPVSRVHLNSSPRLPRASPAPIRPHDSTTPNRYLSDPGHPGGYPTDISTDAHYDHVNLLTEKSDSTPLLRQCQWADSNGTPCGVTLGRGNDMHEHLKLAHGVKSEFFCRWVGCSVALPGKSPHKFASSVERHTWGHSGYRPYKCSACNEGFAAASVRDEHFTNIHLRKKVFSCDMCSHQCTSSTNLKRHKDDKHSRERFQCEFCNRNGKRTLFPRGPNLARHFRHCKYVRAQYPEAATAAKAKSDWLPPGYKRGHHGMDRAKVTPPRFLPAQNNI